MKSFKRFQHPIHDMKQNSNVRIQWLKRELIITRTIFIRSQILLLIFDMTRIQTFNGIAI